MNTRVLGTYVVTYDVARLLWCSRFPIGPGLVASYCQKFPINSLILASKREPSEGYPKVTNSFFFAEIYKKTRTPSESKLLFFASTVVPYILLTHGRFCNVKKVTYIELLSFESIFIQFYIYSNIGILQKIDLSTI